MDNLHTIITDLESNKAENILSMDVSKKTSIASYMIFATGTSNRHVNALSGWIVIDCGDIIVHIFKKEIREFYNLEKMWSIDLESYSE